jgi:hypothetical protein
METPRQKVKFLVTLPEPGLSVEQINALAEMLKCGVVVALPDKVKVGDVTSEPVVNDVTDPTAGR